MSLTLDVNSFLQEAVQDAGAANTHSNCEVPNHMDMDDFHKDGANIFEEIEHLLKCNEIMPETLLNFDKLATATTTTNTNDTLNTTTLPNLNFLPPHCAAADFLIPEETHSFHEDPLLFSVEHGELQPISSPFMVPGIYKKIATATTLPTTRTNKAHANRKPSNVFISEMETHGRIVAARQFNDLYVLAEEKAALMKMRPRKVFLLAQLEHEQDKEAPQPPLKMFKSDALIPKEWDALSKLAYDILKLSNRDHIVIDRKRNEIVRTANGTNQKTIYRFLSPETFGLQPATEQPTGQQSNEPAKIKIKLGRPRKRPADNEAASKQSVRKAQTTLTSLKKPEKDEQAPMPQVRTRSGRLVKLVKPTLLAKSTTAATALEALEDADDPPVNSAEFMRNFLAELKDTDYRCSKPEAALPATTSEDDVQPEPLATSSPTKRRFSSNFICPTCNKIFLGRRLQRHYLQHPDHMPTQTTNNNNNNNSNSNSNQECASEEMTLFRFLIAKLQKSNLSEDQRADLFLNEINDLVTQLQLRSSRLIRNTSGLHFITARTSRVLGIPEGQYALDMSAIEAPPEPNFSACMLNFSEHMSNTALPAPTRSLDYTTLSMSLDDTLTDEAAQKLNLSAGGKLLPPSEESLLRNVDDLVHDGMKKLVDANLLHPPVNGTAPVIASTLVPHYDHASDNAVEAVTMKETSSSVATQQTTPILDLAVDFFQFNNN